MFPQENISRVYGMCSTQSSHYKNLYRLWKSYDMSWQLIVLKRNPHYNALVVLKHEAYVSYYENNSFSVANGFQTGNDNLSADKSQ
jgi:hypothetical protein